MPAGTTPPSRVIQPLASSHQPELHPFRRGVGIQCRVTGLRARRRPSLALIPLYPTGIALSLATFATLTSRTKPNRQRLFVLPPSSIMVLSRHMKPGLYLGPSLRSRSHLKGISQ